MSHESAIIQAFQSYSVGRLRDCFDNIERCTKLLTKEQVWERPNEVSNSVGNLVLHLQGNVRQWIVSGLGGSPFDRNRPAEFAERGPLPTEEILKSLRETVQEACLVITTLSAESLVGTHAIQGRQVTGLAATYHVVEHFSFHTGQIVSTTKLFTGKDLSLYDLQGQRISPSATGSV